MIFLYLIGGSFFVLVLLLFFLGFLIPAGESDPKTEEEEEGEE